jgi:hypothetical protein
MAAFQFYLQFGKQRKVGWVGNNSHAVFGQNSLIKKELWDGTLSSCNSEFFYRQSSRRSLRIFSRSGRKVSQNYVELILWATRTNSFVNNPFDVKENYEHALDFAFHLFRLFRSRWAWPFRVRLMLSSPNARLIIARVSVALFQRFAQTFMMFFVGSIAESQLVRYKNRNKRT